MFWFRRSALVPGLWGVDRVPGFAVGFGAGYVAVDRLTLGEEARLEDWGPLLIPGTAHSLLRPRGPYAPDK